MLVVPTYLATSQVHGIGVYAAVPIPAGSKVWQFNPVVDFVYSLRWLKRLCRQSPDLVDYFRLYSYKRDNQYYYVTDNARFINHSTRLANIGFADNDQEVALRNIEPGEELLENYFHAYDEDDCFVLELHNIDWQEYLSAKSAAKKRMLSRVQFSTIPSETAA